MNHKGRSTTEVMPAVERKEAVFRKQWEIRLAHQVSDLPEFDGVFRAVRRRLRQAGFNDDDDNRSEEHTSELQSLMRISYAVFCLKKKNTVNRIQETTYIKIRQQQ